MIKKMKSCWKQLVMVFIMLFSVSATTTSNVNAVGSAVDFQRVRNIKYPSAIGNWSTWLCTIDGNIAYCLNASKNTPVSNKDAHYVIANNDVLLKVLYYGYGGPGDVFKDDVTSSEDVKYIYTHLMASFAYSGDLYGNNSWESLQAQGYAIIERWNQIQSLPLPTNELSFNGQTNPTFSSYLENDFQRTEDIVLNAASSASVSINLQEGVELHNVTKGTVSTGNVNINGGDKFYLSASLKSYPKFSTGSLTGEGLFKYAPLVIEGGSKYQSEGTLTFSKDEASVSMNVNWMELGSLELTKSDDVGNLIDGAEFTLKSTTTNFEKTIVVRNGKIRVDNLVPGEYILTETKVPKGYAITQQAYQIVIEPNKQTDHFVVNKLRPTGELAINKSLESNAIDTNKANYDLTKVQFKVSASQDIFDSVSLNKLYAKGDGITVGSGKGSNDDSVKLTNGTEIGDGLFSCDSEGQIKISGLPMGAYNVQEVNCPNGFIKDDKVHTIQFSQQDFVTVTYDNKVNVNNELTKTTFSKLDITGEKELAGATLQVKDENGKIVDQWVSSDTPHQINGLIAGNTYILHEDFSPVGYVKANDAKFTVNKDGTIKKVEMKDKVVTFNKVDEDNNVVEGALIHVIDSNGVVVDEWTTTNENHDITGLTEGQSYIIREVQAPKGYVISKDIKLDVTSKKENQVVTMKEGNIKVIKEGENGKSLSGAVLQVISSKTKNIVDEWVTGQHLFDIDEKMKIDLEAGQTVSNIMIDDEDGTIEYVIKPNSENDDYLLKIVKDGIVSYFMIDINGNETAHMIQNLQEGGSYILKEVKAPAGYSINKEEISFKASDKNLVLKMKNEMTKIEIHKQDQTSKKELPGAYLQVIDDSNVIVDEWVSTNEPHIIKGLEVNKTYTLNETVAPEGYKLAQSIDFKIEDTSEIQKIFMYDELIPEIEITKTGDNKDGMPYALGSGLAILGIGFCWLYNKKKAR